MCFLQADKWTDRHDEAYSCFPAFCGFARKVRKKLILVYHYDQFSQVVSL